MACNKGTLQLVISNYKMVPWGIIRSLWGFSFEPGPIPPPEQDPDLFNSVLVGWAMATIGLYLSSQGL